VSQSRNPERQASSPRHPARCILEIEISIMFYELGRDVEGNCCNHYVQEIGTIVYTHERDLLNLLSIIEPEEHILSYI
jgi:hypothetical protein